MKRFLLLLAILFGSIGITLARQNDWSISASATIVSKYVGGTGGALFTNKPCWQTNLNLSHKSGLYFNFWRSLPLDPKYSQSFANETDWSIGYNHNVFGGRFNLDLSATIYDLVPTSDLYAINGTLVATTGKVRPYGVIEHDFAKSQRLPPGTVYKFGARWQFAVDWDLALLGNAGHHPFGAEQDVVSGVRLQLAKGFRLGAGTLTPSFVYLAPLGQTGGLVHNQAIFGLCYGQKF